MQAFALRVGPREDLVPSLQHAAREAMVAHASSKSCFVLTAVGSLSSVKLRLAGASSSSSSSSGEGGPFKTWNEPLEIVSLTGTFTVDAKHLHICVADATGRTFGGHLVEGTILTTLELVLGTIEGVVFRRTLDDATGYTELVVDALASP
jgi:predicted DNA-binding protein with PD1-like motif